MRTRSIPVILMLTAGAVASVMGLLYRYEATQFFSMILTVLLVFYMLGCIVKMIIDRNFMAEAAEKAIDTVETEETKENIDSELEEAEE